MMIKEFDNPAGLLLFHELIRNFLVITQYVVSL